MLPDLHQDGHRPVPCRICEAITQSRAAIEWVMDLERAEGREPVRRVSPGSRSPRSYRRDD
jgi:hypothetical protein